MINTTRHFDFKNENTSKFWVITQSGESVTVRYGKTGANGQSQTKAFADVSAATKHAQKLIAEKLGKGYVDQVVTPVPMAGTVLDDEVNKLTVPMAKMNVAKTSAIKPAKPKNPALDPEATPESLMALLDKDAATNRHLAMHQKASAELLEKLSHSSDEYTRKAVTGNPNIPPETFVRLGQQFPKEFLANPALDLLLLVNPALMDEVPDSLLIRLVKQTDCPASLLSWAAAHDQEKVQLAVAMNANSPQQAVHRLRQSKYPSVCEAVRATSGESLEDDPEKTFEQAFRVRLGSMTSAALYEAWSAGDIGLAQWSALPLTFRLAKTTDSDEFSPGGIARILRDTDRILADIRALLPNYPYWGEVAGSHFVPVHVLDTLSNDPHFMVRASVGRNPVTPVVVLDTLSKDSDISVRANVGSNCSSPVHVLETLAKDSNMVVQRAVSLNPSTPSHLKGRLLEYFSNDQDVAIRREVAANTATSAQVLAALGKDSESQVRREVAKNSKTHADLLGFLAEDPDDLVRAEVSLNPMTPVPVLEVLSRNLNGWIRNQVAANPSTPVHILKLLAEDSDGGVRSGVSGSSSTFVPVLVVLAKDPDCRVRKCIAENPNTPPSVLEKLATDSDSTVKTAVVGNPNTPLAALLKLVAAAKTLDMRLALADQANRSSKIVSALWSDTDEDRRRDVRSHVIRCASLTQEALAEIATWTGRERDLVALLEHPNLSIKSVEFIADKLLATLATDSAWYQGELAKGTSELRKAAQERVILYYPGKDANKAVLAKRAMAPVMALCSGSVIEPTRLVKVVGSTDWLVRAAVARNAGTPPNLVKKLSADAHPLVSALARRAQAILEVLPIKSLGA